MKLLLITTISLFSISLFTACASTKNCTDCKYDRATESDNTEKKLKQTTVILKPGKVYEIAFAKVKEGGVDAFTKEYFPKAKPVMAEYNSKTLGFFKVHAKTSGEMKQPHVMGLFEWPSMQVMIDLHKDKRVQNLAKLRQGQIVYYRQAFYTVPKEVKFVFRSDKTYEFFAAWLKPNAEKVLDTYAQAAKPFKDKYGAPTPLVKMNPYKGSPNGAWILKPSFAGIVEWKKTQDYYDMADDAGFKSKAAPLEKKAVSRLDKIHGTLIYSE